MSDIRSYNRNYMRKYYKKHRNDLSKSRLTSYYRVRYGIEKEDDISEFKRHSKCYRELMKHSVEEVADAISGAECHWRLRDAVEVMKEINEELLERLREFRKVAGSDA